MTSPEQHRKASQLFIAARELPAPEREAFLARACAGEAELLDEVQSLLRSHDESTGFMASHSLRRPWHVDEILSMAAPTSIPQRVGKYRILGVLGRGGMGVVYRAEQDNPKRVVALKLLQPGTAAPAAIERFEREAEVLGRLHHPGIAQIFEAATDDTGFGPQPYFAMELVEGQPLCEWAAQRSLSMRARLELLEKLCAAVQHAHQHGVVHRDLKPANVLVDSNGEPKILDFGIARAIDADVHATTRRTQAGELLGTLPYMSPEQLAGDAGGIDARSDVYALGVVGYELLSGELPFDVREKSLFEALRILRTEEPVPLGARTRQLRGDVERIVAKALEKERSRRYASAAELSADIGRYLRHEPILARPPSTPYQLSRFARRNRVLVCAVAAVLVALSAGLVASMWQYVEAAGQTALAQANERRALAGEALAQRRADEVLRLSAFRDLDDLTAEADRLWPARPERLADYEDWLARQRRLLAQMPEHERILADLRARALPWTGAEREAQRAKHPRLAELEVTWRHLEWLRKLRATLDSGLKPAEPKPEELGIDVAALPADLHELDTLAFRLIGEDRRDWGREEEGLVLAQRMVEIAAKGDSDDQAVAFDTLAWALLANGRYPEASAAEDKSFKLAGGDVEAEYAYVRKDLEGEIEDHSGEAGRERDEREIAAMAQTVADIEAEIGEREEWTFDASQDRWWHDQLCKLVAGLRAFSDADTGLVTGISEVHGWGVQRRVDWIRAIEARGLEEDASRRWSEAIASIRDRAACPLYEGLVLAPQFGLLPIGRDPQSGLWEFAHLQSGTPPNRASDGHLVLTEESGMVVALLPGGSFRMGAQHSDDSRHNYDPGADSDECPVTEHVLAPFFLSKYEMTQGQWLRITGHNPSSYLPEDYVTNWNRQGLGGSLLRPVDRVSWEDGSRVLAQLDLCLPTEAQWEYAIRAGTETPFWTGTTVASLQGAANLADSYAMTHGGSSWSKWETSIDDGNTSLAIIGSYRANAFGLHDLAGNVSEWCRDGYAGYELPTTPGECERIVNGPRTRVRRGGNSRSLAPRARSADRYEATPDARDDHVGVRPAKKLDP